MASRDRETSKKTPTRKKKDGQPWYAEGLQFECTQCGKCCSGPAGYVWVNEAEIERLAKALEMECDLFERRFVRQVGADKSLVEYPDGDCIFLDPEKRNCTVYESRPIQCRTWPFWDSTINTPRDWQQTCRVCPGAGKGKLYTLEQIEFQRKQKSV